VLRLILLNQPMRHGHDARRRLRAQARPDTLQAWSQLSSSRAAGRSLAGGRPRGGSSSRRSTFHGSQLGRGASIGRLLSSRDRHAAFRNRRVVVKYRSVKLAGKGLEAARGHLRYVQRDGVTREGLPGRAQCLSGNSPGPSVPIYGTTAELEPRGLRAPLSAVEPCHPEANGRDRSPGLRIRIFILLRRFP
jgi:hypothetical protein